MPLLVDRLELGDRLVVVAVLEVAHLNLVDALEFVGVHAEFAGDLARRSGRPAAPPSARSSPAGASGRGRTRGPVRGRGRSARPRAAGCRGDVRRCRATVRAGPAPAARSRLALPQLCQPPRRLVERGGRPRRRPGTQIAHVCTTSVQRLECLGDRSSSTWPTQSRKKM